MATQSIPNLPKTQDFCPFLTNFIGDSFHSPVTHLIDQTKDPELFEHSLGRRNFCTLYPKFENEEATYENVLSEKGKESYNQCIEMIKNNQEEGCLEGYHPFGSIDMRAEYNNLSFSNEKSETSGMIFIETNTNNIKSIRPDVYGWCISVTGKLRTMDESTTQKAKKFLQEFRERLGTLSSIKSYRKREKADHQEILDALGIDESSDDE
jgi:hypothetical protein